MAKLYSRSFNGGIISPEMLGRIDDVKYNTGLKECENMIVLPQGPVEARPGTAFVREVFNSAKYTRLIPFRFSTTQTTALEFAEARIRFHTFGATLLTPTTGLSAWDSVTDYVPGDLVTKGGSTWYCVADTLNDDPETGANQYGATPAVASEWTRTYGPSSVLPSGYTFVGSTLPLTVTIGQLVYISTVSTGYSTVYNSDTGEYEIEFTTTTSYTGYTGSSVTAPGGFWFELGTVYEIPSPYAEGDIGSITYVQSADVLTLCHPRYPPYELRRGGATRWTIKAITFGSTLAAPTISSVTPVTATTPSDTQSYSYVATTISDDQLDESVASSVQSATNQLFDTGARNTVNFGSTGRRNVYKLSGGIYGYIGQTTTTALVDDNIAADTSRAPPNNQNPFASDYPGAVGYFEQRRVFAGTTALPQTLWMTKTGLESNLDYSIPVRDDDAISVKMAARESSIIRHIVPVGELLILTDSAEWIVSSGDNGPITPFSISLRPQSYIGANLVQPVIVGTSAVYAAARGGHVRAAGYDFDVNSYVSIDMSLRAAHLFDFNTIVDMAYAKGPVPIVWAVSSNGSLLGMTYVPEQQVYAWHEHSTINGAFESICVVGEGNDDILYAVVRRPISGQIPTSSLTSSGTTATFTSTEAHLMETGQSVTISGANQAAYNGTFTITVTGSTTFTFTIPSSAVTPATGTIVVRGNRYRRYVERMASRFFNGLENFFGVDCGLTYSGASATTISGLDHLEGQAVAVLANGGVQTNKTVSGGQVVLDSATTLAHIGLPVYAMFETLPVAAEIEAYAQSTIKNVNEVTLRVYNSGGFTAGPDLTRLTEAKIRTTEPYGSPPALKTGEVEVAVSSSWRDDGSIIVRRITPTPLTVVSMTLELVFGG
jgi:hypothetical protein